MKSTEQIKVEQPFEGDGNRIYYVNGGRCSGKVDKTINKLVDYANNYLQENKKYKEIIDKAINYCKKYMYTYGIRNNAQQRDELLNILGGDVDDE